MRRLHVFQVCHFPEDILDCHQIHSPASILAHAREASDHQSRIIRFMKSNIVNKLFLDSCPKGKESAYISFAQEGGSPERFLLAVAKDRGVEICGPEDPNALRLWMQAEHMGRSGIPNFVEYTQSIVCRDVCIVQNIHETLQDGEVGILQIGGDHVVLDIFQDMSFPDLEVQLEKGP
jgi:hypothetical protein